MKRVLAMAAPLCLAALALTSSAWSSTTYTTACPAGSALIANVSYGVTGESVEGANGDVWAKADYTRRLTVFRVSKDTYCASWQDVGTFTTEAGPSPGTTGRTVSSGIQGTFSRVAVTTNFTGTFKDGTQTSGSLGTFPAPFD